MKVREIWRTSNRPIGSDASENLPDRTSPSAKLSKHTLHNVNKTSLGGRWARFWRPKYLETQQFHLGFFQHTDDDVLKPLLMRIHRKQSSSNANDSKLRLLIVTGWVGWPTDFSVTHKSQIPFITLTKTLSKANYAHLLFPTCRVDSSNHPNQVIPFLMKERIIFYWSGRLHIKHDRPPKKRREVKYYLDSISAPHASLTVTKEIVATMRVHASRVGTRCGHLYQRAFSRHQTV
jgi:hypothetical protein